MPRYNYMVRQWEILRLLEAHRYGLSAEEISVKLTTNVRTIYRDLDVLDQAGFPLFTERDGKKSKWKLARSIGRLATPYVSPEEYPRRKK